MTVVDASNTAWDSTAPYDNSLSTTGYQAEVKASPPTPVPSETGSILSVTGLEVGTAKEGNQFWFRNYPTETSFFYDDITFSLPEFDRSMELPGVGIAAVSSTPTATSKI